MSSGGEVTQILYRLAREVLSEKLVFEYSPEGEEQLTTQTSGVRVFQAVGTAKAKTTELERQRERWENTYVKYGR